MACARIRKENIECKSMDVRDLSTSEFKGSFDVICLFQVVEHLDRLDELFNKLSELLKEGGRIYIAVPNDLRIRFNERSGALPEMPPNHVGTWTKDAFQECAKRAGLRLIEHRVEPVAQISSVKTFFIYRYLKGCSNPAVYETGSQVCGRNL